MTQLTPPALTILNMQKGARQLALSYQNGESYHLSYEFLRIHSPSAEVKGHGIGQEVLQIEKAHVMIEKIETIGNYAIQIFFNDGHDSGIYSWAYLYELATHEPVIWQQYLNKLQQAGESRFPNGEDNVVHLFNPTLNS